MKYNLEIFDKIINDILNNTDKIFDEKEMNSNFQVLKKENIKIKLSIKKAVFKQKSKAKIEHYIQNQQLALENLIAFVIKKIKPKKAKDLYSISSNHNQIDSLKIIYNSLEKLQLFIETNYFDFLNLNSRAHYRSLVKRKKRIAPKIKTIRETLLPIGLEKNILRIVFEPLKINALEKASYNKFNYYCQFTEGLYELLNTNNSNISEESIFTFLVENNHNSKTFFEFQIRKITNNLQEIEPFFGKMEYLIQTMKIYYQTNTSGSISYNRKRPSNRELIIPWIEAEINYLTKKNNLENSKPTFMPRSENKIKIHWGLSVVQLSYFHFILHKIGAIQNKNQRDLFRFMAENYKTPKTDSISFESISNNYYNVEASTKEAVKSVIINMLNLAK